MNTQASPPKLTTDQQAVLDGLVHAQVSTKLSDDRFAKRFLDCSGSKWNRIRNGEYWQLVDDSDRIMAELKDALGRANLELELQRCFDGRPFVETDDLAEVRKALRECAEKPLADPARLVVFLAPTGAGKTFFCQHLRRETNVIVVEARKVWTRSYFYCLRDICLAAGVSLDGAYSSSIMEQRLLEKLASQRQVLVIDEAEFFGVDSLNLLKLILNRTLTAILICAVPAAYDALNRGSSHEASQVRRRTHRVVRMSGCDDLVIEEYLKSAKLGAQRKQIVEMVKEEANRFGGYDFARLYAARIEQKQAFTPPEARRVIETVKLSKGL